MHSLNGVFDVCVIGSGAGGAPLAWYCAHAGLRVVMLEKGKSIESNIQKKDELTICRRPLYQPSEMIGMREIHYENNSAIQAVQLWPAVCVGGGTKVMSGFFFRMSQKDFLPATIYGVVDNATVRDWPITSSDLGPWYDHVAIDCGMSGTGLPLPDACNPYADLLEHPVSRILDQAGESIGVKTIVTPRAVLAETMQKRGPCSRSGLCGSYACRTGAKASTTNTYIPKAMTSGNFTLLEDHCVYKLEGTGDAVTEALYITGQGISGKIRARIFVVACGAIESARLFLNSHSVTWPQGLANTSGQLGKNLTFTIPCEVDGYFDKQSFPAPTESQSPFIQRSTQSFVELDDPQLTYRRGGTVVFLFAHPNPIQRVLSLTYERGTRIYGIELKKKIRHYFSYHHIISDSFIDFIPNTKTYMTVSNKVRDKWGIPCASIFIKPHQQNYAAHQIMAKKIIALYRQMGALGCSINPSLFTAGELQHGTARFGIDPKTSVLNSSCRTHDCANLYVTDGSFFPSGLPIPSTYTIMANSLRVAHCIVYGC